MEGVAKRYVDIEGVIDRETDKAFGVRYESGAFGPWIPKSVVGMITYTDGGDSDEVWVGYEIESIEVATWFADKNGL